MKETKIMIVEDDVDQAVGLSIRLRANGYKVLFASDGTAAFTQACQLLPDLIILVAGRHGENRRDSRNRLIRP